MNKGITKNHMYDSIQDIISKLCQKVLSSCVMINDKSYHKIVKGDNDANLNAVSIILDYNQYIKLLSIIFHSINIETSMADLDLIKNRRSL